MSKNSKAATDNRSRQLNPQDATYWASRGETPSTGAPQQQDSAPQQPAPNAPQAGQKSGT